MKKLISLLLVAVMLVLCVVPAAAEPAEKTVPLVIVRGMDFMGLRVDRGTENERNAVGEFDTSELLNAVVRALGAIVSEMKLSAGLDVLLDYFRGIYGLLSCDENGDSVHNVSAQEYPLAVSNYPSLANMTGGENEFGIIHTSIDRRGAQNTYYFNYDWRCSPLELADGVNAMVERAKEESGCDKIDLVSASMGGMVTVSYLTKYGCESLRKCVFLSSSFCGAYVASDLFSGRIDFDGDSLYSFLAFASPEGTPERATLDTLQRLGIFKVASLVANVLVGYIKDYACENFVKEVFGYMPGLWSLMLPEDYDGAIDYFFKGRENTPAEFLKITDALHEVAVGRDEMLREAQRKGVEIAVVAGYGTPLIPVYERATEHGDGDLETALMAGHAIVAPHGKTLGEDYIPADPRRLSPDRTADLSGCLFPEHTWLIANGKHVACSYGTQYADFVFRILSFEGAANVESMAEYPQFMKSNSNEDLIKF